MTAETPKRSIKAPLKAVNETPKAPPVERPKKERKPLYVPPAPKGRLFIGILWDSGTFYVLNPFLGLITVFQ